MALLLLTRRALVLAAALCGLVAATARAAPADGPADGTWSQAGPPGMGYGRTVFVDPVDGRLTLFAARFERRFWKFDAADGGQWTPGEITGPIPNLTGFYGPVVDRARRRLVAVGFNGRFGPGGFEPDTFQVWQLPLEGTRSWSRLSTEGTPPRGRYAPEVTLDDATGTLYLVGGTDEIEDADGYRLLPYGDTWALDLGRATPAWSSFRSPDRGFPAPTTGRPCSRPRSGPWSCTGPAIRWGPTATRSRSGRCPSTVRAGGARWGPIPGGSAIPAACWPIRARAGSSAWPRAASRTCPDCACTGST